jgi:hypothetical protein
VHPANQPRRVLLGQVEQPARGERGQRVGQLADDVDLAAGGAALEARAGERAQLGLERCDLRAREGARTALRRRVWSGGSSWLMLGTGGSTLESACAAVVPCSDEKVCVSSVARQLSSKRESAQPSYSSR